MYAAGTAAPFAIRASKDGYLPDVKTHPGIVNSASGFPTNTTIHFNLLRSTDSPPGSP